MFQRNLRASTEAVTLLAMLVTFVGLVGGCNGKDHAEPQEPEPPPMGQLAFTAFLPPAAASEADRTRIWVRHLDSGETKRMPANLRLSDQVTLPSGRVQVEMGIDEPNGSWAYRASAIGVVQADQTTALHLTDWEQTVEVDAGMVCLAAGIAAIALCVLAALLRSDLVFGVVCDSEWLILALSLVLACVLAGAGLLGVAGLQWMVLYGSPHWAIWVLLTAIGTLAAFELSLPVFGVRALDAVLSGSFLGAASVVGCLGWLHLRGDELPWLVLGAAAAVLALLIRLFLDSRV